MSESKQPTGPTSRPTIGLSMIVKNGGDDLRACLASVAGLVDQIVIGDTGSTDSTLQVALEFHATVLSTPWTDHFADARNLALNAMVTDWVLVLDADEALEPISAEDFRRLTEIGTDFGGYLVPIRNYFRDPSVSLPGSMGETVDHKTLLEADPRLREARSTAEHTLCRLFRRHPKIHYSGRIHEVVETSIVSQGLKLAQAPFRILHYGQLSSPEIREQKNFFYRRLGQLKVAEEPNNYLAWYELGSLEHQRFNNLDEALRCLNQALQLAPANHPFIPAALTRIFNIHAEKGELVLALGVAARLGPTGEQELTVVLPKADLLATAGRLIEAQAAYQQALNLCNPSSPPFWPIQNRLGLVEVRLGHHVQGLERLEQSTAACPHFLEHHENRMHGHLLAGNLMKAAQAACETLRYFLSIRLYLQAALLLARAGDSPHRRTILQEGLVRFPNSIDLAEALARPPDASGNRLCLQPLAQTTDSFEFRPAKTPASVPPEVPESVAGSA